MAKPKNIFTKKYEENEKVNYFLILVGESGDEKECRFGTIKSMIASMDELHPGVQNTNEIIASVCEHIGNVYSNLLYNQTTSQFYENEFLKSVTTTSKSLTCTNNYINCVKVAHIVKCVLTDRKIMVPSNILELVKIGLGQGEPNGESKARGCTPDGRELIVTNQSEKTNEQIVNEMNNYPD